MDKRTQREIMRRDNERRAERAVADYLALQGRDTSRQTAPNGMPLDYMPNSHRDIRVSPSSWDVSGRVVGVATGTEKTSDGTPTVRVIHSDGTEEIRTVSSIRRRRNSRPRQTGASRDHAGEYAQRVRDYGANTELANE
jgi:hypothetical protein